MRNLFKFALATTVAVMASLGCNAQLVIRPSGHAHFGDTTVVDSTAIVHVAGYGVNGSKGTIAFGNMNQGVTAVSVGEYPEFGAPDSDKLWLHGRDGLVYSAVSAQNVSMKHIPYSGTGFNFFAPLSARAFYVATDPSLNSTSSAVTNALNTLADLSVIRYRLDSPAPAGSGVLDIIPGVGGDAGLNGGNVPGSGGNHGIDYTDSLHYGLNLASVLQTLPELVTEDTDGVKYVDYNSLIPLLVVAVNELKEQVDELTEQVELLQDGTSAPSNAPSHAPRQTRGTDAIADGLLKPALYQNAPNPFNAETRIGYCLPESVVQADLYVYDLQGKQVKKIAVTERGESSVTIHGSELQAGMYIYCLIADGHEIDSKRMILTK